MNCVGNKTSSSGELLGGMEAGDGWTGEVFFSAEIIFSFLFYFFGEFIREQVKCSREHEVRGLKVAKKFFSSI